MSELEEAVTIVVERCLRVRAGETVLVVADPDSVHIGQALLSAARAAGGDAVLTILPPNPARGTEPPAPVAAALAPPTSSSRRACPPCRTPARASARASSATAVRRCPASPPTCSRG